MYMDGYVVNFYLADLPTWDLSLGSKLHPGDRFIGPWTFLSLKISHHLMRGSNFTLSSVEVGHWVAQTQPLFEKLPEITDFGFFQ